MGIIVRSNLSKVDAFDIAYHIAQDNPAAARHFLRTLEKKLTMLARHPLAGRARPSLQKDLRSFSVGDYLVFYRPIPSGIELARILHGARHLRRSIFRRR